MLNLRVLGGTNTGPVREEERELEWLIKRSIEERRSVKAMLLTLMTSGEKMTALRQSLDQASDQVGRLMTQVDQMATRIGAVDDRTRELDGIDRHIQALKDSAQEIYRVLQAIGPPRDLKHDREEVQRLSSHTQEAHAKLEELKRESGALRDQLHGTGECVQQAATDAAGLRTELDEIRAVATSLAKNYDTIHDCARQADEKSNGALMAAQAIEHKLPSLNRFLETSQKNEDVHRDAQSLQQESAQLLDCVRAELDAFVTRSREFELVAERVPPLKDLLEDVEARTAALDAKEADLTALAGKASTLKAVVEDLAGRSDALATRQETLAGFEGQLTALETLAARTSRELTAVTEARAEVDAFAREIEAIRGSQEEMSRVNGSLTVEREALERCADRMSAMAVQAPALDAKMDAILGKLPLVAEGTERASRLSETVATLTNHVRTLNGRLPHIERLEGRLMALDELSQTVDQRLTAEHAKQAELETFQKACEALRTELADVQQQLDTVRAVEDRLAPLTDDIDALTNDVTAARMGIASLKVDAAEAAAFEQRYGELVNVSKALSTEIGERILQVQALSEELSRSASMKDELIAELSQVQERQHELDGRARLTEDWLARAESAFKELDERVQSSWLVSLKWRKPGAGQRT